MILIDVDSLSSAVDIYFADKARTKKSDALKLEAIRLDMHGLIDAEIGVEFFRMYGHWIDETFESWGLVHHPFKCNLCGEHAEFSSPYCPNCGAKMDGGGEKNETAD